MSSRAYEKLQFAIKSFNIDIKNKVAADFGASTGGFTKCLLDNGAIKVYAIDTAYGELDWNLRNNTKVVALERNNAMHIKLPEFMDLVVIDVGWTPQIKILPNALNNLKKTGLIISLIKPHYEASKTMLYRGKLKEIHLNEVIEKVKNDILSLNLSISAFIESPLEGKSAGNKEFLALLKPLP